MYLIRGIVDISSISVYAYDGEVWGKKQVWKFVHGVLGPS